MANLHIGISICCRRVGGSDTDTCPGIPACTPFGDNTSVTENSDLFKSRTSLGTLRASLLQGVRTCRLIRSSSCLPGSEVLLKHRASLNVDSWLSFSAMSSTLYAFMRVHTCIFHCRSRCERLSREECPLVLL